MFTTFHWKSLAKRHYSTYSLESIKVKPFAIVEQCHFHLLQSFKWNCKHFISLVAFNQHHCRGISLSALVHVPRIFFIEIRFLKVSIKLWTNFWKILFNNPKCTFLFTVFSQVSLNEKFQKQNQEQTIFISSSCFIAIRMILSPMHTLYMHALHCISLQNIDIITNYAVDKFWKLVKLVSKFIWTKFMNFCRKYSFRKAPNNRAIFCEN